METISIRIIEDNLSYRLDLQKAISKYIDKNPLIFNYDVLLISNYIYFYENLDTYTIKDSDIFIIDIQLNTYFTGIDAAQKIRKMNMACKIIFLTSMADKALETINKQISPSGFLVKTDDLEIIQLQLITLFNTLNLNTVVRNETITVTSNHVNFILNLSDILYLSTSKGFRNKLIVQTLDSNFTIDGTLTKMKSLFPSPPFYLDFKSFIVNYNNIKNISSLEQNVIFKNDIELELNAKLIYKLIRYQKGLK